MHDFTHLHVHTQFSILDGAAEIGNLITKTKAYGMKAIAITDHGNMFGVLKFVDKARQTGIKPIIGCEMYVAEENRFEKKGKEDRSGYHLILLSKNKEGYQNLSRLSSLGYIEGFYYTPRIDKEILRKYSEGLIACSACLGGEIPSLILEKGEEKAEKALLEYLDIFHEDFYFELQRHGHPEQDTVNEVLIRFSKKYNIKLIATNDIHFVDAADAEAHDILVCLNTGKDLDDEKRMKYTGNEFLKTPEEMTALFSDVPEAITNTQEIVDKIEDYELTSPIILPVFPLPENFSSEDEYLKYLTFDGAKKFYPQLTQEIEDRLNFELSVIKSMGFAGYFLIVQDFINEARNMDVEVGPGRGSVAGSAVAFCTGITSIDPIKYNLLFERFLNPERISMPDIDVDFDDYGREKVLQYVVKKYGEEKVAQIVTFGTMAAKSAIRDVARVLKLPLPEADKLAKLVPEGPKVTLKNAYKEVMELANAKQNGSELVKKTLIFAEILEGSARHTGTHACGVIIGPDDLIEHIPLCRAKDSTLKVTQYEGKMVESVGMLKMDFLGLKTLTIIKDAIENIFQRHQIKIDINAIPLDDKKTFELYQKGETIGTFQFESDGMRAYLKDLKPNSMEDLIAMNALYRPGPMDFIPLFINRKQGRLKTEYPHPMLEGILKPTYGIMVYQEQIMQTAQIMGGFTLGGADLLRRAMGKKNKDIMETQKAVFVQGALGKGINQTKAEDVFHTMEKFAEYGFNRSHSAAYSVVAYQTAYLKANYTAEYMAAVLTNNLNDIKKITFFMEECKRQNIPVLGPDVNESELKFVVNQKGEIRFGLGAVKNVGEAAVESIALERKENGPYKSVFDFTKRVNLRSVNKRCLEALAMAGAFDGFNDSHRAQYFYQQDGDETNFLEKITKHANYLQSIKDSSQTSLFGDVGNVEIKDPKFPVCEPWTKLEQLKKEKEVTGFYISGHPLDDYKIEMENFCNVTIGEIMYDLVPYKNRDLFFGGIITSAAHKTTKTGRPFGTFVIEDYNDSMQIALFSDDYLKYKAYLEAGYFVLVKAKPQLRYNTADQLEIKVLNMAMLADVLDKLAHNINIHLPISQISDEFVKQISDIVKEKKGSCNLKFTIVDNSNKTFVEMPANKHRVNSSEFLKSLTEKVPGVKFKIN